MDMITKIHQLKSQTDKTEIKSICESTIAMMSSAIYNGVTFDAQLEIERVALNNLFESLAKYKGDTVVQEWLTNQKRLYTIKHLGVRKAIDNLLEREATHDMTLNMILEDFKDKLTTLPEVRIYESFISSVSQWSYLPSVKTELSAIGEKVKTYKNDIDISKIISIMEESRSNYLIPLIKDVVDNYLSNKTEQTKHILKETLVKFSYDQFIRDILDIVSLDATQLQLEYANAECDIQDSLFSPILYIGENEVIFNVRGSYYVKKGNNINRIKSAEVRKLDESFRSICDIVNLPSIEISKKDIKVFIGNDNAVLTESETFINGSAFTQSQINESAEVGKWSGNADFYGIVNALRENFNEIAEIDFVKRVYLKENENYAADIFKLRDNIFITTFDPLNNKATFYRNINPIQAEKVMMEHMRFDVSKTFRDILPNKEKILSEIEATKKEYADYINELNGKIEAFSIYGNEHIVANEVIKSLQEELKEVKNDYKNYLNEVESYISIEENLNITVQDDQSGKSYTVVVPTGAQAAKGSTNNGEDMAGAEGDEYGTEVGMASMKAPDTMNGPSSAVTFDDDQSELISDEPSMDQDKVDLGADDLEAYADKVDAEAELEAPETGEEGGQEGGLEGGQDGEQPAELGDTGGEEGAELNLDGEPSAETDTMGTEESPDAEGQPEDLSTEEPKKKEEATGAPNTNLEKTNFNKDKNPEDLDEPKKIKKVFLKRPKTAKK